MPRAATGIVQRHSKRCATRTGERCNCTPTWQAFVYDARTGRKLRRTLPSKGAAKTWRQDMLVAVRRGEIAPASVTVVTVASAAADWLEAAERGTVRTRGRKAFSPGTIGSFRQNYRKRIEDRFGRRRIDQVTLLDLQQWVDELDTDGVHPSTIETSVLPLRLIYRREKARGRVLIDPTDGLELPEKPQHGLARTPPSPDAINGLLAAVDEEDRAAWAVFILCGLRRGELLALRWSDVDIEGGTLRVERSYVPGGDFRPPKSRRSVRTVPVGPTCAGLLRAHRLLTGRRDGLVFGRRPGVPMDAAKLQRRADQAWKAADLERVTPHVCRHLYASVMAAAGVSLHVLSRFMGHSSIAVTFDRYGHLFPGEEAQAATLQEAFLAGPNAPNHLPRIAAHGYVD